jgi:hypothetical protein
MNNISMSDDAICGLRVGGIFCAAPQNDVIRSIANDVRLTIGSGAAVYQRKAIGGFDVAPIATMANDDGKHFMFIGALAYLHVRQRALFASIYLVLLLKWQVS